jgi:hypothetical protein
MLIPRTVKVKRHLVETLRSLTPASGLQYAITVREFDEDANEPQADVEVMLVYVGSESPDSDGMYTSDRILHFMAVIVVSNRLANEDTPIDEVAMTVGADVWAAVMQDPYRGGNARKTLVGDDEADGDLGNGYYAHRYGIDVHVRFGEDDPFFY